MPRTIDEIELEITKNKNILNDSSRGKDERERARSLLLFFEDMKNKHMEDKQKLA